MAKGTEPADTTAYAEDMPAPTYPGPGFRIGEYLIKEVLGHGAMATVYLATDITGHEVALKVFVEGPGVSATMLERFRREAEASKKLRRHPHIVTIYATGKEGPYQYIAMESIKRSKTVEAALESMPMSLDGIVELIIKIARALQYAHSRGIVHRDVKPTNIMIDEFGEPLLADFGVASFIDGPTCTMTGALTGTPLYMSPEQARGERVGPLSDIYSIGVVLFEAVTGVLPYSAHHRSRVREVLDAVKHEPPRRPRLFRREITPNLEAVMLKALEKDPVDRYPDAEAFAVDLERALAGRRVSAHHFSRIDYLRHLMRRYRQTVVSVASVVTLLCALLLGFHVKLVHARFEGLLHLARFVGSERARQGPAAQWAPSQDTTRAWYDIKRGRRAMLAGDFDKAAGFFSMAVEVSREMGDKRTVAIAQLEQARCQLMDRHNGSSLQHYQSVIDNPDAPPILVETAQLEYLMLLLIQNDKEEAYELLVRKGIPRNPAIQDAVDCVAGDLAPTEFLSRIPGYPPDFQNDALLVLALRAMMNGNMDDYRSYLREAIQRSSPSMEWPAPLVRQLAADMDP
ncbi:MAG: serine/threonine protein kinase [Spartobacteria bacterium]|nr:serine/threonine protein kinase [Spartobacteria bacterium]